MLTAKIDLNKVDKTKLFAGKNGAQYLDVVLIETPNNRYGDSHMVCQSVSREDRAKGIKGAILGNARTVGVTQHQSAPVTRKTETPAEDVPW